MQLNTAIAWAGHAELFDFNAHIQKITADPDAALVPPTSTTENALEDKGSVLAIALGHGKADWVKNVLAAGQGDVHFIRRDVHITNPRILPVGSDDDWLPRMARLLARWEPILVADIT